MNDDALTRNEQGELAVRTVSTSGDNYVDKNDVYTRDDEGKLCVRTVGNGGGDQHNLGYYETPEALRTAHPTAEAGDFAIVNSTDTVWIWDADTSAWKDGDTKGQVTSVNGYTGAVVLSPSDIGATAMTVPSTMPELVVANWSNNSQTVSVTGVTATNVVLVAPAPTSAEDYASAGIVCTAQSTNSLTFSCQTVPTNAITVNVVIMD